MCVLQFVKVYSGIFSGEIWWDVIFWNEVYCNNVVVSSPRRALEGLSHLKIDRPSLAPLCLLGFAYSCLHHKNERFTAGSKPSCYLFSKFYTRLDPRRTNSSIVITCNVSACPSVVDILVKAPSLSTLSIQLSGVPGWLAHKRFWVGWETLFLCWGIARV